MIQAILIVHMENKSIEFFGTMKEIESGKKRMEMRQTVYREGTALPCLILQQLLRNRLCGCRPCGCI